MSFWSDKRVVVEKLHMRGCWEVFVPRSREYDLREKEAVVRLYGGHGLIW